ncbi:MAG: hypothetical protein ABGZ53_14600, partial [Fuerstiella sp.]
ADSAWLKLIAALADIDTTQRYMDPLTEPVDGCATAKAVGQHRLENVDGAGRPRSSQQKTAALAKQGMHATAATQPTVARSGKG